MSFPHDWRAEVLAKAPLIAPARQFTYPRQVAGEEDALARGALLLLVHPAGAVPAEIFSPPARWGSPIPRCPPAVFACPNPSELCAVAGGYAYVLDTARRNALPTSRSSPSPKCSYSPRTACSSSSASTRWSRGAGKASPGRPLASVGKESASPARKATELRGFGWNLQTDKEVEFAIDLRTGAHTGGG